MAKDSSNGELLYYYRIIIKSNAVAGISSKVLLKLKKE